MGKSNVYRHGRVTVPAVRGVSYTAYGIKTHYVEAGTGDPIVLVHGGTGSGELAWMDTLPGLAPDYRAIALDVIGFGHTDKPRIDSYQMMVDHVAGFIDTLNIERVGMVGQSMGAYIAAKYACDYPERVTGLAMFNTATVAHAMDIRLKEKSEGMRVIKGTDIWSSREALRQSIEYVMHDQSKITDELVDHKMELQALPGWHEARIAREDYLNSVDDDPDKWQLFNLVNRLPNITVPSTLIWGVEDRFALVELGRRLHEVLPETAYHEIEGGSHHCFRDVPDVVNKILVSFFSQLA